jgi:hypothetical protein
MGSKSPRVSGIGKIYTKRQEVSNYAVFPHRPFMKVGYNTDMSTTLRNVLFVIIGLLVIAVAVLAWFLLSPMFFKPSTTSTSTPVTTQAGTQTTYVAPQPAHLTAGNQYYTADMEYPPSTPLAHLAGNTTANTQAVETMKVAAQNAINTFVQDGTLNDPPQGEINSMAGQQESLSSTYKLYTGPGTITYVFTIVSDTLGAHPNSSFVTYTFDSKTGQALPLYNIFNSGADYLDKLSSISRATLTAREGNAGGPSFINPGTTPDNTNFQDFALDGTDLDLFFAPYEVAPYSSGPQIVKIPLSQLSSLLKSQYQ